MRQPKCSVCSYRIRDSESVVFAQGDLMHTACFRVLSTQQTLRDARRVQRQSRDLIEKAREVIQRQRQRRNERHRALDGPEP